MINIHLQVRLHAANNVFLLTPQRKRDAITVSRGSHPNKAIGNSVIQSVIIGTGTEFSDEDLTEHFTIFYTARSTARKMAKHVLIAQNQLTTEPKGVKDVIV